MKAPTPKIASISLVLLACSSAGLAATGAISILPMAPGDSTPFVVRVTAQGLQPDSTYEFAVWVYGGTSHISRRWTSGDWEYGAYYDSLSPDSAGDWANWVFLKIIRSPEVGYDYYLKYRMRDGSANTVLEESVTHSQGFRILDMATDGGWLEGLVYADSGLESPYERVVLLARDPWDSLVGGYESEENGIEEGSASQPGYFCLGVGAGQINGFECRDLLGDSVEGYFERQPPWVVNPGETTFVSLTRDLSVLPPISFEPDPTAPGSDLEIRARVLNRGNIEVAHSKVFSFADRNYNYERDPGEEVDQKDLDHLAPQETLQVSLIWNDVPEGVHSVFVQVEVLGDEHPENDKAKRSLRAGSPLGDLVLNELMYHPLSGETEWIEIHNRSSYHIPLENWAIEDEDTLNPEAFSVASVAPAGFLLLVSDSGSFHAHHPEVGCPFLKPEGGLPSLNDAGDRVALRNSDGVLIDEVSYEPEWGGRSGVSLERINPDLPSQDPSNWGSCVFHAGGTPGETNSIYVPVLPARGSLSCSPKVFSPDGDGVHDRIAISYELPLSKAKVRLLVYDRAGRRVKALLDQEESGATSTLFWDGRGEDGRVLPMGMYIVYLEAVSGREVIKAKKSCVLAKKLR